MNVGVSQPVRTVANTNVGLGWDWQNMTVK